MVIFRENSEDIYAGVEFESGSVEAEKLSNFLVNLLVLFWVLACFFTGCGFLFLGFRVLACLF